MTHQWNGVLPANCNNRITAVLDAYASHLLQRHGVGHGGAVALLLTVDDNSDRMNSEPSFAASAPSPLPDHAATDAPATTSTGALPKA